MDNTILSVAFLLNTDDAMVISQQHLHVKEKTASEKYVFVSMMLPMSIVGKFSDLKDDLHRLKCVDRVSYLCMCGTYTN